MNINYYIEWDKLFQVILIEQRYLRDILLPSNSNEYAFYRLFHSDEYKRLDISFDDCVIDDNIAKFILRGKHGEPIIGITIVCHMYFNIDTNKLTFIDMEQER